MRFVEVNEKLDISGTIYYYNGTLYDSLEALHNNYIENYNLLNDDQVDYVTDEEMEAIEINGQDLIKFIEGGK